MESQIIKIITENGLGAASFAALLYFGWQVIGWMRKTEENHLTHIQSSLEGLNAKTDKTNEILQKIAEK